MTVTRILANRSDVRLASSIATEIVVNLGTISSVLDIGCGDGIVSRYLPKSWSYQGIDLADAAIYEQNKTDERIKYSTHGNLKEVIEASKPADAVLLLDVLEHTKEFSELFRLAIPKSKQYIVVSVPNELFILDRLRLLAGKEHPAHSLDLLGLPEGFKHQFLINPKKAMGILNTVAYREGFELDAIWERPLLAKNQLVQPMLWLLRKASNSNLWSMGSVYVFRKKQPG